MEKVSVGVVKQPDKVSFSSGWGVFVKTYDLHTDDSLVFKYNGNSRFNVVILSRFGYEKATSVVVNDESVPLHVQRSSRDDMESVNPETETMQMRSPPREVHTSIQKDSSTDLDVQRTCRDYFESVNLTHEHDVAETMQMRSLPWERQTSLQTDNITLGNKTMKHLDVHRTRRDDIDSTNPANDHPETLSVQSTPRERRAFLQVDSTIQGNKTNPIFPATCLNSSGCKSLFKRDNLISRKSHLILFSFFGQEILCYQIIMVFSYVISIVLMPFHRSIV